MLGATLLTMVWKYIEAFDSHVTKELVKLDLEEIVVLMESIKALHKKVEATKKMVMEKIHNQALFIPKLPSAPLATTPIDILENGSSVKCRSHPSGESYIASLVD